MKNVTLTQHILLRIVLYGSLFFMGILLAYAMLNPNRKCSTGDALAVAFFEGIFYVVWAVFLLIEAFFFHKKQQKQKRNANLIMVLFLPSVFALVGLFFWIKEFFD